MTRPLDGITVVSLEHAIAAPFCTRQLADLGARVIKVERPGAGDFARAYDTRVKGQASHFVWTNRSKESLTLDLKQPKALEALKQLLEKADVLVQNLAPGAAARMGLSLRGLAGKAQPDGSSSATSLATVRTAPTATRKPTTC
jgi:itaconate CoA-transferase